MEKNNKFITFALVGLLAIFLQVMFVFADIQDTPNKAVIEFAKAYFAYDEDGMRERLCEESMVVDEADRVGKYIYESAKERSARGYGRFYLMKKLYHVDTYAVSQDYNKAEIRLVCETKPPLRAFFSKEKPQHVDEVIQVVKEDGKWKVCGTVFSLPSEN